MADVKFSVVTAMANQEDAIELAFVNGVQQTLFTALAVPLGSAPGTPASHCFGTGWMAEEYKAIVEAYPALYQVLGPVGRPPLTAAAMLATHNPQLQPWAP